MRFRGAIWKYLEKCIITELNSAARERIVSCLLSIIKVIS